MEPTDRPARLEFSLDARERLLSEAERIARMGSFAWNVATGTIHWSDELFRIFGREPQGHAPTAEEFFGAIHPDDVARVQDVAGRGVATGVADTVEFRILRPDGSTRYVQMNGAALFDDDGTPSRFVGTLFDISDRISAELEQRRRELVLVQAQQVAHVGSFEWTTGSDAMRWSDELLRICGVESNDPGGFSDFASLVHPDDRAAFDGFRSHAIDGVIAPIECRIVRRDGRIRHVRLHAGEFHDERGTVHDVVGTVHDVTELRKLESQVLQSQKMEALGRLAGGIAHDFNNLLTVIGLHVARLRRDVSTPSLGAIAKAIDHASSLTHQLLAFSRQSPLTMRAVDLVALVGESVAMVERLLDPKVALAIEVTDGAHVTNGDPAQITQVLMNLLLNARDAMPKGGTVTVTVTRRQLEREATIGGTRLRPGAYVTLAVRDEGVGMDEDVRLRMFEPFFTTKELGRGTGLGMSMVFGIVSQLGGAIDVASEVGHGSTITVLLPEARVDPSRATPSATQPETGGAQKLLLVEDEAPLREILGDVLRDAGFEVCSACDGDAALEAFDASARDISMVISDVRMPGLSGPEVVARIRRKQPGIKVLFISGHAPESGTMSLDDSCTRFLRKPFTPAELVTTVRDILAQTRAV